MSKESIPDSIITESKPRSTDVPIMQRWHWLATSTAAILTTILAASQLQPFVPSDSFGIVLVALSVGILIAIYSNKPSMKDKPGMNWTKAFDSLASSWVTSKSIIAVIQSAPIESEKWTKTQEDVTEAAKIIRRFCNNRAFARSVYRVAILENETALAEDIRLEIEQYDTWIEELIVWQSNMWRLGAKSSSKGEK